MSRKFKPGDIVRVVSGVSKTWILPGPMLVTGYYNSVAIYLKSVSGGPTAMKGCGPYCLESDCELDVFLNAASKAVRNG